MRNPNRSIYTAFLFLSTLLVACSDGETNPQSTGGSGTSSSSSSSSSGGGAGGAGGFGPTGSISGPVKRYDYTFDITSALAHTELSIDVQAPGGNCYSASCKPDMLSDISWNGAPADTSTADGIKLTACGPSVVPGQPLMVGATTTVPEKTYIGLDVGFSRSKNLAGGQFSYLLSWVGGCSRFSPCDTDPAQLSEFHYEITHPAGTTVLCPGMLTPGATLTQCDIQGTLAPTYSGFALAADPMWQKKFFVKAANVDLVFYEVPGGQLAQGLDSASVSAFMDWITNLLSPYPYGPELRFAGGPTAWLGFEHPANIILNESLSPIGDPGGYQNTLAHVFMHEIVHQWAGDRTTLATAEDFVWKEATAEYLAYVFEDEQRPAGEAAKTRAYWDSISLFSAHYPRPTDDPPPAVQAFYGDVYGPGPMVLYLQLETMLGRKAVLDGIHTFLAQPGAKSVDELRLALQTASGQDLSAYFNAWVFGKGKPEWPTLNIASSQAGSEVTVTLTQNNLSGILYGCMAEVEVQGATQSVRGIADFGVAPSNASAIVKVMLAEPVQNIILDPDHKLIARQGMMPAQATPALPKPKVYLF